MFRAAQLLLISALFRHGLSNTRYNAPFGCPSNLTLRDENRTAALAMINTARLVVAQGVFQPLMSSASFMNKLVPVKHTPTRAALSSSIAITSWSMVQPMWPSTSMFTGNLRELANLMFANATAVGCTGLTCNSVAGQFSAAACVFSHPRLNPGNLTYPSEMPCQHGQRCSGSAAGICENGLCVMRPNATTTTTAAANTTTTTPSTTTTTTTRRRSTDCPSRAFSSVFREVALGMHNNFRSLVAGGLERNGEYANENSPPAARMDLMEYDCQAEQLALNHVRLCDRQPSPPFVRPGYSENIHVLGTTATDLLGAIQNAIATFIFELRRNGIPSNMILAPHVFQRTQRTVTRVSKVLWASNRFVGCATQLCSGFYFTSCMYREPVNVVGANIYPIGAVCSACPTGPNNCNLGVGLCSY